jgi:hypothetical protein
MEQTGRVMNFLTIPIPTNPQEDAQVAKMIAQAKKNGVNGVALMVPKGYPREEVLVYVERFRNIYQNSLEELIHISRKRKLMADDAGVSLKRPHLT